MRRFSPHRGALLFLPLAWACGAAYAEEPAIPAESMEAAKLRHERVAARRKGVDVICHRGASEHAHENTLEAFRAAFELGADGNEIDIRATKDGVLVAFHDDMLDRLLEAYGDVGDYTWEQLRRFRFRAPGRFGEDCRIPTLVEVFDLHRKYGGLMHLDIKRPGLDRAIADLLTRMDLWDHVGYCNTDNGGVILRDSRLRPRRYKTGLYLDRSEVFPEAIARALKLPGDGVIVDDPRGVAVALGRKLGPLSREPVSPRRKESPDEAKPLAEAALIAALRDAADWGRVAETAKDRAASGQRIVARARAADQLLSARARSKEALQALEERVRKRSLHKEWMYHGLDGATALRALLHLRAPGAVEAARFALWRDDPALEPVVDPRWKNPRAWTDFRVKMVAFPALASCPGAAAEKLCRDYLTLSDEDARRLGPPQFEEAARALLAVSPRTETALELLKHRLQVVRGRAVLVCLAHAGEGWAREALEKGAPFALPFVVAAGPPLRRHRLGYTELRTDLPGGRHANVRTMRAMVSTADGSERRLLGEELAREPDSWTQFAGWSPDGNIAVVGRGWQSPENARWEEEHRQFRHTEKGWLYDSYLLDLSSGQATNVTAVERVSFYNSGLFFWPNDPTKLGFTALIGGNSHPFRMGRDGRNKVDLTKGSNEFAYGFNSSRDGKRIAYHKNYQVYLADADGSNAVHVKTGQPFNFVPTWSPDGKWVLFLSGEHYDCHPHLVRADGTGLRKLADRAGYKGVVAFLDVPDFHGGSSDTPAWSADGRSVFYTAQVGKCVELFQVTLDGKASRLTTSPPGTLHYHPQPSPDGGWLAYGSKRDGVRQLYVMRLADRAETRVTSLGPGRAAMWPHWRPASGD